MKTFILFMSGLTLMALGCSKEGPLQPASEPGSLVGQPLSKTRKTVQYQYYLGEESDPAVSEASKGDRIEIIGEGTFSIHPKQDDDEDDNAGHHEDADDDGSAVTGGGTFVRKDVSGNVLEGGSWTATQLTSFRSYGSASVQGLPVDWEGGLARIRVHLSTGPNGVLAVDCALGDFPASSREGATLKIRKTINFNKKISGGTLFIRTSTY